jgi:hypothetical protein
VLYAIEYYSATKGIKYWFMLPTCGWAYKTLYLEKGPRHQRAHIEWFHLYEKFSETPGRGVVVRGKGKWNSGFSFGVVKMFLNTI